MSATAGVAAAISAAAAAQAQAAREAACRAVQSSYRPDSATVGEMREYASCVQTLYPDPLSADATIALKVAVALIFCGVIGGFVYGRFDDWDSWFGRFVMYPVMGGFIAMAAEIAIWFAYNGIKFLVS